VLLVASQKAEKGLCMFKTDGLSDSEAKMSSILILGWMVCSLWGAGTVCIRVHIINRRTMPLEAGGNSSRRQDSGIAPTLAGFFYLLFIFADYNQGKKLYPNLVWFLFSVFFVCLA
jgi:hypothetical protein